MSKRNLKNVILRNFAVIIFTVNISLGLLVGFLVRNYQVDKRKDEINSQINKSIVQINNELIAQQQKMNILSEIVLSQINNPRAFYDINSVFKAVLSSNPSINKSFITLLPGLVIMNDDLYNLQDSLGRFNVTWTKDIDNIVYIDSINTSENNYYFESVKNKPALTVFNSQTINKIDEITTTKPVVFPLFDGTSFLGIFGFELNSDFLKDILSQNNIAKYTFITDEKGIVMFDRTKNVYIGKDFTYIIKEDFSYTEPDILHNKSFFDRNNRKVFFFNSFTTEYNCEWKFGTIVPANQIYSSANWFFVIIVLSFAVFAAMFLFILNRVLNKSTFFLNDFLKKVIDIKNGKLTVGITESTTIDEFDIIIKNLEELRKRLLELVNIQSDIKEQNIKSGMFSLGADDTIANSINSTIEAIQERTKQRQEAIEVQRKNEWISEGLNILHEAARVTGNNSIETLTNKINEKLSVYTDAFLSAIYIYYQSAGIDPFLIPVSTFGLNEKHAFFKEITLGEGIVGTVAQERKTQFFKQVPEDYNIIVAGLGNMRPKSILVQTLEYEGEFYGILEIAFLRELQQYEINFFAAASAEIALSIKNLLNNISTNELVEKMKNQTTEIEKTQVLLQQKIKEISNKERESLDREAIMRSMLNAVNNTLITIEYTTSGILLNANEKYLKTMHYTIDEIRGVNVLELVKTERAELEQIIQRVAKGEYYEKIMKRFNKYGEVRWLYSTYTPYYDASGNISKIIYFAFDLTDTKKYIEKLEKEISMLRKQVKILREKI